MKHEQMNERMALLSLAEYKETLERLRRLEKLCARSADALSCCNLTMQEEYDLIAELREAAE